MRHGPRGLSGGSSTGWRVEDLFRQWERLTLGGELERGAGLVTAGGPQLWPLRMLVGPSARARLLRWFLPITFLVVLLDEVVADTFRWYHSGNSHWYLHMYTSGFGEVEKGSG